MTSRLSPSTGGLYVVSMKLLAAMELKMKNDWLKAVWIMIFMVVMMVGLKIWIYPLMFQNH